jgi:hypothetical protein
MKTLDNRTQLTQPSVDKQPSPMEDILRRQADVNVLRPVRDSSDWAFYSTITGRDVKEIQTELFAG